MKRALLSLALLAGVLRPGWAQGGHPYAVQVGVLHESVSLPGAGVGGLRAPLHPGVRAGTEFYYGTGGKSGFFQSVSLTYYFHRKLHHHFSVSTRAGYRYHHRGGLFVDAGLGLGYTFLLADGPVYAYAGNGDFARRRPAGLHRLLTSLGASAGHRVSLAGRTAYPYLRYEILGETPFNKEVPLLPHILLEAGVRLPVNPNKTQ
jgi:hypothetical protein